MLWFSSRRHAPPAVSRPTAHDVLYEPVAPTPSLAKMIESADSDDWKSASPAVEPHVLRMRWRHSFESLSASSAEKLPVPLSVNEKPSTWVVEPVLRLA